MNIMKSYLNHGAGYGFALMFNLIFSLTLNELSNLHKSNTQFQLTILTNAASMMRNSGDQIF